MERSVLDHDVPRRLREVVRRRVGEEPVVALHGARTVGKSTLLDSAAVVALGLPAADPLIGLVRTMVISRITWQSFRTIRGDAGAPEDVRESADPERRTPPDTAHPRP